MQPYLKNDGKIIMGILVNTIARLYLFNVCDVIGFITKSFHSRSKWDEQIGL